MAGLLSITDLPRHASRNILRRDEGPVHFANKRVTDTRCIYYRRHNRGLSDLHFQAGDQVPRQESVSRR
jgi:hypothetical protein